MANLDLKATHLLKGEYLQVDVEGIYAKHSILKILEKAMQTCQEHGITLLLLQLTELDIKKLSIIHRYLIGEASAGIFPSHIKVAVILNKEDYDGTTEIIAKDRGVNTRFFFSINEGEDWLLQDKLSK